MKKVEDIYCVYCGTKNKISNKKCFKCSKKIDPKDDSFKNYMIDKFKSDADSNIYDLIKSFLLHHIYGILLTVTVVFTSVSIIINQSNIDIVSTNKYLSSNGSSINSDNNSNNKASEYSLLTDEEKSLVQEMSQNVLEYAIEVNDLMNNGGSVNQFYGSETGTHELYNYIASFGGTDQAYCYSDSCFTGYLKKIDDNYVIFVQNGSDNFHFEVYYKMTDDGFYIFKENKVSGIIKEW